jgi:superfamily I DNA/RNA helicase
MPDHPTGTQRTWVVGVGSLTPDQRRVVNLDRKSHHLVCGPAGSGKTLLALHRARHLLDQGVPKDDLRVLVYTKVLRHYIGSGAEALGVPEDITQSFFSWVFTVAKHWGVRLPYAKDFDQRFALALKTLLEYVEEEQPEPILEVALVDEGQDLTSEAYRLLTRCARHVTVFADEAQRLYENGVGLADAIQVLGLSSQSANLLRNLRNSQKVARVAATFLPPERRDGYLKAGHYVQAGTVRVPSFYRAPNEAAEWERLAAIVRGEIERNARVGILLPTNRLVGITSKRLGELGVPIDTIVAWEADKANFNDLTPKALTIHGAKGLSLDTVLLPRLSKRTYANMGDPASLLFVGTARALDWVYLSTTTNEELPELAGLAGPIASGDLIDLASHVQPVPRPVPHHDEDDLPL